MAAVLHAVAPRICRNDEDARDVVQSAYLSAFRSLDRFAGASQLSTWLHRIVVNVALMRLRSRRRKPEESLESLLPAFRPDGHHVEEFSDWTIPVDRLLDQGDLREGQDLHRTAARQLPARPASSRHRGAVDRRCCDDPLDDADGRQGEAAQGTAGVSTLLRRNLRPSESASPVEHPRG